MEVNSLTPPVIRHAIKFNLHPDAIKFHFSDEETGCTVASQYVVSIRRRWNYENNCAAIICYVSTGELFSRAVMYYQLFIPNAVSFRF